MEEYIYIILGVLWLAATIFRASKKKGAQGSQQKATPAANQQEKPVSSVKSLLEQLLEGQQLSAPEPEVIELEEEYAEPMVAEIAKRKREESYKTEYTGYGYKSLESVSGEGISSLGDITFVDQMKQYENKARGPVKIDLRKAIIYKAILERPYS